MKREPIVVLPISMLIDLVKTKQIKKQASVYLAIRSIIGNKPGQTITLRMISDRLGGEMSLSNVSYYLKKLKTSGLISAERKGYKGKNFITLTGTAEIIKPQAKINIKDIRTRIPKSPALTDEMIAEALA